MLHHEIILHLLRKAFHRHHVFHLLNVIELRSNKCLKCQNSDYVKFV